MSVTAQMVKELRAKSGAGMMDCKKALVETNGDFDKAIDWLREKGIANATKKGDRIAAEGLCSAAIKGNEGILLELNSETDFVAKNKEFLELLNKITNAIINSTASNKEEALKVECEGITIEETIVNAISKIGENFNLRRVVRLTKKDNETFGSYIHMGGKIVSLVIIDGDNKEVATDIAMQIAALNPQYKDETCVPSDIINKEKEILKQEVMKEGKPENIAEKMVIGRLNKFLKDICLVNQPFIKEQKQSVNDYLKSKNTNIIDYIRFEVGDGIEKKEEDFAKEVMSQINK